MWSFLLFLRLKLLTVSCCHWRGGSETIKLFLNWSTELVIDPANITDNTYYWMYSSTIKMNCYSKQINQTNNRFGVLRPNHKFIFNSLKMCWLTQTGTGAVSAWGVHMIQMKPWTSFTGINTVRTDAFLYLC